MRSAEAAPWGRSHLGREAQRRAEFGLLAQAKRNKNIVFSSSRQWNPGDEAIMCGTRKIIDAVGVRYNPILYNRNPDIRSCFADHQIFRTSRTPDDFHLSPMSRRIESNIRFNFYDNSFKPDSQSGHLDWAILAGTPEWCNGKMVDLFQAVAAGNIPIMIIGVGGGYDLYRSEFHEIVRKAKVLTVRDAATFDALTRNGLSPIRLPCPALLCADDAPTSVHHARRRIGLIFQVPAANSVIWNGFSKAAYDFQVTLYRRFISQYEEEFDFEVVCHYIDEIHFAIRDFPALNCAYSYEQLDYMNIYSSFDFVIGPRVHGIGIAASCGVPGAAITHDSRGGTCEGFLAETITIGDSIDETCLRLRRCIDAAPAVSHALRKHKLDTFDRYLRIVQRAFEDSSVDYGLKDIQFRTNRNFELRDLSYSDVIRALDRDT